MSKHTPTQILQDFWNTANEKGIAIAEKEALSKMEAINAHDELMEYIKSKDIYDYNHFLEKYK